MISASLGHMLCFHCHPHFQIWFLFLCVLIFLFSVTSPVWAAPWTRTTARPTPLRRIHPLCQTVLPQVTAALASFLHPPPRVSPPPPHVRLAPHAHLGVLPVSRAHSSMRTPNCTPQRPPLPPADR